MVGSLMLWKLMHCKRFKKRSSNNNKKEKNLDLSVPSTDPLITVKIEVTEENKICRVCLKNGEVPIYDNNRTEDISEALISFGGIEITPDDEYPKFLCESCYALLRGAILFRKTAQDSDQRLRCPQKESDFESKNTDTSFDYDKKEKDRKKYICKKCDIDFDTFSEYSEHRLSQEHENLKHTCPICKNSYSSFYIKKHMAIHTLEISHVCDICGKKFTVKGLFTRHRQTHFNNFPFSCSLCPYKGRFKESLKMHMRSHTGEKNYQCTRCPSKFIHKSNLNAHMLIHKDSFDFKCETCGRGFYNKRSLEQHIKVDHNGVKEHTCNICGKAFGYRKQMMKHQLRVHKREKFKSGRMPLYLQIQNKEQVQNETYQTPLL
ncbi:gastrula zinc finger protein XlCGF8.2DB [Papilio machaon]|uniref:gastrula zinc finger protein XlCGF8.2DB n=1 Tax=Papilio machaon TaxID=76193 RepID=UPI001E6641D1|nr:gastrula zinc finger protein XlCGF8.2DB [Papilio machaon]